MHTRSQVIALVRRFFGLVLFNSNFYAYFQFIFFHLLILEMTCILGVDIEDYTIDYWIFVFHLCNLFLFFLHFVHLDCMTRMVDLFIHLLVSIF